MQVYNSTFKNVWLIHPAVLEAQLSDFTVRYVEVFTPDSGSKEYTISKESYISVPSTCRLNSLVYDPFVQAARRGIVYQSRYVQT